MSETEVLIEAVVTRRAVWSEKAVETAVSAIVDTLGVGVAGVFAPQARIAAATILPTRVGADDDDSRVPVVPLLTDTRSFAVADSAFVLGTAIHSMDWDDFMHPMHGHCSVVLLGALLPLGEAIDRSGKDLVDAFMVGYQVDWLVSLALSHAHYHRGWHATSTIGVLGAAAACCHMLGLDATKTRHALGIAASRAGGIRANFGTTTKALHAGFAARAGVEAALLARAGATSSGDWLVGPSGMIATFGGQHTVHQAIVEVAEGAARTAEGRPVHALESPWGRVQKPFACCGSIHGAIDALLTLREEHGFEATDVASVVAHVDPIVLDIMRYASPSDENQARYSPTWVMAATLVDGAAGAAQFGLAALARPDIWAARDQVAVVGDWSTDDDARFGGRVVVELHDGNSLVHEVSESRGHPRRPLSAREQEAKLRSGVATVLDAELAEPVVDAVRTVALQPVRRTTAAIRNGIRRQLSSVDSLQYDRAHEVGGAIRASQTVDERAS
ncbi:hypothetical protein ASG73_01470 [Janibacter sp. Soil728]|uniref:MmgE/PrpD family protein n=1 Tax=Janibacter sp. Soil728 TaxID=1736393 RepID=UPI0006FC939E|nr:MmgE/PrpD family protein [Janibacter sp. Soil728]KRE39059.1 hypothetical protein ASG73_01470 [Janibacter sp. Soil728]